MAVVFWVKKGLLMVEFMQHGTTITSEACCEILKKLHTAIHNKRCGMLTFSVVFLHDNTHLQAAASTQALLEHFNWELSNHPPYGPELSLSIYYLFTYLKNCLG
jgi:hypothetical protein